MAGCSGQAYADIAAMHHQSIKWQVFRAVKEVYIHITFDSLKMLKFKKNISNKDERVGELHTPKNSIESLRALSKNLNPEYYWIPASKTRRNVSVI